MNTLSKRTACSSAALLLGLLSPAASAHLTTGNLQGDAPAGVTVSVRNVATEHRLQTVAAENGRFYFRRLPVGIYEVVIRHSDGSSDPPILARARLGETVQVN